MATVLNMSTPATERDSRPRRALLVIDVQNEYFTGNLPIGYPDRDGSLKNITTAMDAATRAGIPVVVVRQLAPETSPIFAKGSHGAELLAAVADRPHEHDLEKTLPSCFTGTDLAEWLTARDIDTLVITGYMTQNCNESTARDAVHRGYAVEYLADATGALAMSNSAGSLTAREVHESVLVVLQSRFAAVTSTAQWIAALESGEPLERSNIYATTAPARLNQK